MSAFSVNVLPNNSLNILRNVVEFRKSPMTFFVSHMTDEDGFVLDLLQSMYSEEIPESVKIQIIAVLQDSAPVLLTNSTSIEQTIGSLRNIYRQADSRRWLFQSQVLVAITTILLGLNQLAEQKELVVDLINLLLGVISKINNGADRHLRGTACECLREIETIHPGILMKKVEHLYSMIQLERTHVCQSYMALFVTVLNNVVVYVASSQTRKSSSISDMLCNRKEPLKPLILAENFSGNALQLQPKKETLLLPSIIDTCELKRASAFLMESLSLMTTPVQCYVLNNIMQYIATVPSLSSLTFKSHLLELFCTLDLSLFHLALQLKAVFKENLISDTEEDMLLRRLLLCTNHPSLTAAHRLLCCDWLKYFPENEDKEVCALPKKIMVNNFSALFPKVFDGLDTTLIKLSMLNECFTPSSSQDASISILMGCLQPLQKSIRHGITGRSAVTLYRALFQYFKKHHNTILKDDIFSLLLGTVLKYPVFTPHTINFLHCVHQHVPQSDFPVKLLKATAEEIVEMDKAVIVKNLNNYLLLMERISAEVDINPKPILCFLHWLLKNSNLCTEGNWLLGNNILGVCNSCMHCHNTTDIFTDLGNLLYVMLTEFNQLDVRDRARFYYAILTNLSTEKVSRVVSHARDSMSHSLSTLADSINIPSSSPVQRYREPVLQLTRVSKEGPTLLTLPSSNINIKTYFEKIQDTASLSSVTINYRLHFNEESELEDRNQDIYAIVIHLETSNYHKMEDYQVSHLGQGKDQGVIVHLQFSPLYTIPTTFSVSAIFSLALSRTATCKLADLHVRFEDLFLPLPVSPELRAVLFKKLWKNIRDREQESSNSLCTESVCVLQIADHKMDKIVTEELTEFLVLPSTVDNLEKKCFLGIFLPPQSHLLLRITSNDNKSVVSIATDNWKILALTNKYLHDLEHR
ncbi:AP-5 complex subunit beta-1-like [Antedon mediterranea]|uniref:AP-5 complex subunit beta-1-like n=1 Tax=Antedon mediterranea TaxID=105859 RepID=UPI003AF79F01